MFDTPDLDLGAPNEAVRDTFRRVARLHSCPSNRVALKY